jgi:hypothetical protein
MELIGKLLFGTIYSITWGITLLVVALIVLPEKIFLKVIRKFKPDLVSKSQLLSRVPDFRDEKRKEIEKEISVLMKEKTLLEGNLFFLDLQKNLSSMLVFSASCIGYGETVVAELLKHSMEYLQYYARQLEDTPSSSNQRERVFQTAEILKDKVNDTLTFLQQQEGEDKLKIAQISLRQGADSFDSFMKDEYDSAIKQLVRINQLLSEKFMHFIGE